MRSLEELRRIRALVVGAGIALARLRCLLVKVVSRELIRNLRLNVAHSVIVEFGRAGHDPEELIASKIVESATCIDNAIRIVVSVKHSVVGAV